MVKTHIVSCEEDKYLVESVKHDVSKMDVMYDIRPIFLNASINWEKLVIDILLFQHISQKIFICLCHLITKATFSLLYFTITDVEFWAL